MSDLALTWRVEAGDMVVAGNDVALDDGLETAVILSLFCDRRAALNDVLPDQATDPRGWWGDLFADVANDQIGSRLWLLERAKQEPSVLRQAEAYAREALQWLIDDHVASEVIVAAEFTKPGWLGIAVRIVRPHMDPAAFNFSLVWNGQAAKG
jgi:phage gp46-like protein